LVKRLTCDLGIETSSVKPLPLPLNMFTRYEH
jgi:hypothetical protein